MDWLSLTTPTIVADWRAVLGSILLALGMSQVIATTYIWSFRGLSYSRTMVQGMVLAGVITATLMLAVGTSIAAGIGVAAGLAAIRFRSTLRDPRDIVFLFAAMTAGIASGMQAYTVTIAGTLVFSAAALALHASSFGAHTQFDGLLRFSAPAGAAADETIAKVLRAHCRSFVLVTLRQAAQGAIMEHAYQVTFPDPEDRARLVSSLQAVEGVQDVALLAQEPTVDL